MCKLGEERSVGARMTSSQPINAHTTSDVAELSQSSAQDGSAAVKYLGCL